VCEEEDVLVAEDWQGLARALEPLLSGASRSPAGAGTEQGMGIAAAN
jgi:hypothetical protein